MDLPIAADGSQESPATMVLPGPREAEDHVRHLQTSSADFAALMTRYGKAAPALRHFGLIRWGERQFDGAALALACALSIAGDVSSLWSDLAGVYDGWSDPVKAEACIRKAIRLDPHQSGSWLLLANLARQRGASETADEGYRRAIAIDPALAPAHFGLGVVQFDRRRYSEAAASFRAVIGLDPVQGLAHTCLGHVLYATGEFVASAEAFDAALRLAPLDAASRRKHARARTFETMMAGDAEAALLAYPALAGEESEPIDIISRDAFALFSAYGHLEAAAAVGRIRLARHPDDPIQRYLYDAVRGEPHTIAPADYIEANFDRFAAEFDHQLVEVLHYEVPQRLQALVARHGSRFADILDLGCGTGLAAQSLASFGGTLTGVDLSAGMLAEARKRGRYDGLIQADVVTFLRDHPSAFDLIVAADLLIYFGDLAALLHAASASLRPGGLLALSIETTDRADFVMLPSGRFAHAPASIERLAGPMFDLLDCTPSMIRLEASHPVEGKLFVLRRRAVAVIDA